MEEVFININIRCLGIIKILSVLDKNLMQTAKSFMNEVDISNPKYDPFNVSKEVDYLKLGKKYRTFA